MPCLLPFNNLCSVFLTTWLALSPSFYPISVNMMTSTASLIAFSSFDSYYRLVVSALEHFYSLSSTSLSGASVSRISSAQTIFPSTCYSASWPPNSTFVCSLSCFFSSIRTSTGTPTSTETVLTFKLKEHIKNQSFASAMLFTCYSYSSLDQLALQSDLF